MKALFALLIMHTGLFAQSSDVERAQKLFLQKDRIKAAEVLNAALARETKTTPASRELARLLDQISNRFLTDKAQGLNALAQGVELTRPAEALEHYREALLLEPGHRGVMESIVRTQLRMGDCPAARETLTRIEKLYPVAAGNRVAHLQILYCSSSPNLDTVLQQHNFDSEPGVRSLVLWSQLQKSDLKKAAQQVAVWEKLDPLDPEGWRWKWALSLAMRQPDTDIADRYIRTCRNLDTNPKLKKRTDPYLCSAVELVAQELQTAVKENAKEL